LNKKLQFGIVHELVSSIRSYKINVVRLTKISDYAQIPDFIAIHNHLLLIKKQLINKRLQLALLLVSILHGT